MLIVGNLSGIQDFLFDVRESGGKQAASLRFRSFRIQIVAECIARRVLWALDLPESDHLLYCAAGKFAIDATGIPLVDGRLESVRRDVEKWLLEHTHGRLRFAVVADDSPGSAAERNDAATAKLQREKLRPWAATSWRERPLVVPSVFDRDSENDSDKKMDDKLKNARTVELALAGGADSIVGVSVQFTSRQAERPRDGRSAISLERMARPPRHSDGSLVEFVELARRARGAAMLGVLKADADSLGVAIRKQLGASPTFDPLRNLSNKLDGFFGDKLQREMSFPSSRWNDIYTVFAGGDDLLLVGPWDVVIDFAAHVRDLFVREFKPYGLTLSAGCAIVKPKFPIHLAVRQADDLLEQAKAAPKDQFAVLGDVWRWDIHDSIVRDAIQLAEWVAAGGIQRGWLYTLLELTLLSRGEGASRTEKKVPAMATSRLAYHVARNWPKIDSQNAAGRGARRWIDGILEQADCFQKTRDSVTLHLPAIIRYATLATRSNNGEES